ncbi:DNA mismatch repair endonuclease MutL [Fusobacterium sp.]|uniref:DNA mismatch repair endonuclease MutL n=2 Tax=Fusobacterium sp. TaxID=68766 RepID=UPI002634A867|nr:DNA mismatch repair endonuclease MutL [Fusobacterium sp.]
MGIIKILDEKVSNMIAAGEVVENPASMVKELLENSIDAKSTYIKINIKNGNRYVKISDNGKGMTKDDVLLSVERHATSKISTKEDLSNILTYGFRGEALSSISAVSKMSISSKTAEDSIGTFISLSGGKVTNLKEVQREKGTEIEIKDLFFNTPARLKFLRKESTEFRYIKDIVTQEALANPNISIILSFEDKEVLRTSGRGMKNTILEIFGKNTLQNVVSFPLGFLGNTSLNRSNKDGIFVFINNRPVKSKIIEEALIDGYYTKLMKGRYPFAILFIEIDPKEVDVNVHPSKKIVKFSDEKYIYDYVHDAVIEKLIGDEDFVTPSIPITNKSENNFLDVSDFTDFTPKTFKEEVIKSEPMSFDIPEPVKNYEVNDFNILDSFNKSSEENKEDTSSFENTSYNFSNSDNISYSSEKKETKDEVFLKKEFSNHEKTDKLNSMASETINSEEKTNSFTPTKKDYRVIGQFANSYILVERKGVLEVYDQHVVHERILYEKFKEEYQNKKISTQNLLVPIKIDVSNKDREIIENNLESLKNFGFEIDFFGKNDILVRAIPNLKFYSSIETLVRDIIEDLKNTKIKNSLIEEIVITASCKNAIKANHPLTNEEIEILLDKFYSIKEYTCPHGRPIILKLTTLDIEKSFKRK